MAPAPPASAAPSASPTTHRQVWAFAAPLILANVSVPLLGAVDTAVVGHLPEPYYIGAVAIGAMLFNYLYHLFNCLRMGTTGPTAQACGAGDYGEARAIMGRALLLAAVAGGTVIALQSPVLALAFWLIDASPLVEHHAREYFAIRVWAMPAVLGVYAMVGWLYGLRNARAPLAMQVAVNLLNIGLDLLFVFGFGWGVAGVAWASLMASYAGLALGGVIVIRALAKLPTGAGGARLLDRGRIVRMIAINGDIVLRTLCVVSVSALFTAKSAELGDVTLAANQVLQFFLLFTSFGLDGVAHASEAILGEKVGRRDPAAFRQALRVVFRCAAVIGAVNVILFAALGPAIIGLMTGIPAVRAEAVGYLAWPVLLPFVSVWAYTYDGVYLAATRTRIMRNTVVVAFALFLTALYGLMPLLGNTGLWIAVTAFLGGRGLLLHLFLPRVIRDI